MKKCIKCNIEKNFVNFYKSKKSKDGHKSTCKNCRKEEYKIYRKTNIEKEKLRNKNYYERKKEDSIYQEKQKIRCKEYNKNHKKEKSIYNKKYAEKNKDKFKLRRKKYYNKHKNDPKFIEKNRNRSKLSYNKHGNKWYENNKNNKNNKERKKKYYENNKESINIKRNEWSKDKQRSNPIFKLYLITKSHINSSIKRKGYTKKSRTYKILGCSFEEFKIYLESKFEPWMNWENHGLYNGELNYGWDIDHIIPLSSAKTEEELLKLFHYTNCQPLCSKVNRYIKKDIN